MSSSDGTGPVRKASAGKTARRKTAAGKTAARPGTGASASGADEAGLADPWFTPGPKASIDEQSGWFLPSGRAGLLPDAITEAGDDTPSTRRDRVRAKAAGAPPWGGDSAPSPGDGPPPWETGPWPGAGEEASVLPTARAFPRQTSSSARTGPQPGVSSLRPPLWLLVTVGAVALVVIVVIVMIDTSISSGGSGGCATYPAAVRQAYSKAMSDLAGGASRSVQAKDLEQAANVANSSAVAAGKLTARTALFTMASDLADAHADVLSAGHNIPPDLKRRLTADGTALPRSCS